MAGPLTIRAVRLPRGCCCCRRLWGWEIGRQTPDCFNPTVRSAHLYETREIAERRGLDFLKAASYAARDL